jgi:hypothetical protein
MERKLAGHLFLLASLAGVHTIICLRLPASRAKSSDLTIAFPAWWLRA